MNVIGHVAVRVGENGGENGGANGGESVVSEWMQKVSHAASELGNVKTPESMVFGVFYQINGFQNTPVSRVLRGSCS
jgi:hypothetical protein